MFLLPLFHLMTAMMMFELIMMTVVIDALTIQTTNNFALATTTSVGQSSTFRGDSVKFGPDNAIDNDMGTRCKFFKFNLFTS